MQIFLSAIDMFIYVIINTAMHLYSQENSSNLIIKITVFNTVSDVLQSEYISLVLADDYECSVAVAVVWRSTCSSIHVS